MKNLFENYSLDMLNKELMSMLKNNKVNNLKMFVASEENSKISVTLKPDLNFSESYHGLHPTFDENMLKEFLSKLECNKDAQFWDMVKEYQNGEIKLMNLILIDGLNNNTDLCKTYDSNKLFKGEFKEELEESLLGKAILQMASHFGYVINCDIDLYEDLKSTLNSTSLVKDFFWDYDDEATQVKLLGVWPDDVVKKIVLEYDVTINGSDLSIKKFDSNTDKDNYLNHLLSFNENWKPYFKLITSDIYYSGVMPCVKKIDYEVNQSLSGKVKYIVFHVVRTTYSTVDAFDNSQMLIHPFLKSENSKKHYDYLVNFNHYEDCIQKEYLYKETKYENEYTQRKYERDNIEQLNEYLRYSLNTHTIAVSTNLITSDEYLIAAKRGGLNIDAGEYYCSANGQTEFRDENVSFYRKSVFEDMPTMEYFSKYRVDITNEVQRECIAELGITSFNLDWSYYGVSYLGINNNVNINTNSEIENSKSRRMHFNVLMSNSISYSFKEVDRFHKNATESFENESLVGIKIKIFRNNIDLLKSLFFNLYYWVDENKSRIFLFLILISILLGKQDYANITISNYFDLILITVYLSISLLSWIKDRQIRKRMIRKYYYLPKYLSKNKFKMNKILYNIFKKTDNVRFHAIFKVMYILHFLNSKEDIDN